MSSNTYNIIMKTPLGERTGTLVAESNGSIINGWMDIMRHREPFEGTVDEKGNCCISGVFITLIRRVSYVATGQISSSSLHLKINDGQYVLVLTGTACSESEE